eukprot:Clim_evm246s157 gene=Clim_evmTU246s157
MSDIFDPQFTQRYDGQGRQNFFVPPDNRQTANNYVGSDNYAWSQTQAAAAAQRERGNRQTAVPFDMGQFSPDLAAFFQKIRLSAPFLEAFVQESVLDLETLEMLTREDLDEILEQVVDPNTGAPRRLPVGQRRAILNTISGGSNSSAQKSVAPAPQRPIVGSATATPKAAAVPSAQHGRQQRPSVESMPFESPVSPESIPPPQRTPSSNNQQNLRSGRGRISAMDEPSSVQTDSHEENQPPTTGTGSQRVTSPPIRSSVAVPPPPVVPTAASRRGRPPKAPQKMPAASNVGTGSKRKARIGPGKMPAARTMKNAEVAKLNQQSEPVSGRDRKAPARRRNAVAKRGRGTAAAAPEPKTKRRGRATPQPPPMSPLSPDGPDKRRQGDQNRMRRDGQRDEHIVCNMCEATFTRKSSFKIHWANQHGEGLEYICEEPDCGKAFHTSGALSNHKLFKHTPPEQYTYFCPVPQCAVRFPRKLELNRHLHACKLYKAAQAGYEAQGTTLGEFFISIDCSAEVNQVLYKVQRDGEEDSAMDVDFIVRNQKISCNLIGVPLETHAQERVGSIYLLEDLSRETRFRATMARYVSKDVADVIIESSTVPSC